MARKARPKRGLGPELTDKVIEMLGALARSQAELARTLRRAAEALRAARDGRGCRRKPSPLCWFWECWP